jgi:hypothetical protein
MAAPIRRRVTFFPGLPDGIEAELITPSASQETGNRYELPDGTILILKVSVNEVWRAVTNKDISGNPLFAIKSQNSLTQVPPQDRKIN